MKRLPFEVSRNGYRYILVRRSENTAVFCQTYQNVVVGYEVFKIRVMRARFNKFLNAMDPDKERFPCNEDFGKTAWTKFTIEEANLKYNQL